MFTVGQQVTKVNVGGKVGSASVYEIATITQTSELDRWSRASFEDEGHTVVYTVRKVGGKGKGGCWYTDSQLVAV